MAKVARFAVVAVMSTLLVGCGASQRMEQLRVRSSPGPVGPCSHQRLSAPSTWKAYCAQDLNLELAFPPDWNNSASHPLLFRGDDGWVELGTLKDEDSWTALDACRDVAEHSWSYGTSPRIEALIVSGHDACIVLPSEDVQGSTSSHARLAIKLTPSGSDVSFILITADPRFMRAISDSVQIV